MAMNQSCYALVSEIVDPLLVLNYYLYSGHSVLCLDPVSFWQYPGMDIYFVPFGTFLVIFLD